MTLTLAAGILLAVLATSVLSGILGMAGGVILMAVLVATLSVSGAMVLHGAVQAASNGARFVFLRQHMMWSVVPPYMAGAALVVILFSLASFVPDPAVVLVLVGTLPWLARILPKTGKLDVRQPVTAMCCGSVVTGAQLLAGASGPLLDAFYVNTPVDRFRVVATKAFTQTLGHLVKLAYYATLGGLAWGEAAAGAVPIWIILAGMATAVVGARIGTRFLARFEDNQFRRVSQWVILALATLCIVGGLRQIIGN